MAYRLGEYVVYGELRNTSNYSTHGVLLLRGEADSENNVVRFDLTGNPGPDLLGKTIRFRPPEADEAGPLFPRGEWQGFHMRQIGATATMTADDWARALPCPVEEFVQRSKLGEPPPTEWVRRLYLEWYSQNGRVVVEIAGPIVEECVRPGDGDDDEGDWRILPQRAPIPDLSKPSSGPQITVLQLDGGVARSKTFIAGESRDEHPDDAAGLQAMLDREAAATERALHGGPPLSSDEDLAELELMDWCIEQGHEQPIVSLLASQDPAALPPADTLDDDTVEMQLKVLLGELARLGIALDVCPHFTPRDCYRLLRDTVLPKNGVYRELIGTSWVQHVSTWEYCPACESEAAADFREYESRSEDDPN